MKYVIIRFWAPGIKTIQRFSQSNNLSDDISSLISKTIAGFLLVNTQTNQCCSMKFPKKEPAEKTTRRRQKSKKQSSTWIEKSIEEFYK